MNSIGRKFALYYDLMRLGSYTGYMLTFFPAAFGIILAADSFKDLEVLPLFLFGSIISRSAGCIINDVIDRKYDKYVERTKNRPLATGEVSKNEALILFSILSSICLLVLFLLSVTSIIVGFIAFLLMLIYPLMKRITYFPQFFLGITFNLSALIAYASNKDDISFEIMVIYISCIFWTMGYDTIYSFMDFKDDKKIGVKSTGVFFEQRSYKFWITAFYTVFIVLFAGINFRIGNYISVLSSFVCYAIILWQVKTLDIHSSLNCFMRFKGNLITGGILFISLLTDFILYHSY